MEERISPCDTCDDLSRVKGAGVGGWIRLILPYEVDESDCANRKALLRDSNVQVSQRRWLMK